MKKGLIALLVGAMCFSMVACSSSSSEAPAAEEEPAEEEAKAPEETPEEPAAGESKGVIALSLKTVTNDAFQAAQADAVQAAVEAAGYEFQLVTAGSETEVSTQVTQIEDLVTKGVDGIVIDPMDANAVLPAMQKAKDAGIPVVLTDSAVAEGNEDLYITYIGTDNYAASKEGAEYLTEALENKGNVILVRGANGNSVGEARANGYKDGLGDGITLVGEQPGDWSNDVAKQVVENMLQANPDVAGIMTCSDVMLDGILEACSDAGLENVLIMSFDGSDDGLAYIKEGKVLGSMAQFPDVMGSKAVEILTGVIEGTLDPSTVESYIDSGTICYNADNIE